MIKGTGVDIIEISRIEKAVKSRERFASRIFTAGELGYCLARKPRWSSLAARFAAKEAVSKALGTGFGRVKWTDIEVVNDPGGKPEIRLHGAAQQVAGELGISKMALSLSHCHEYAVAFVVAY
ncbi:MAG: holo-ACP synthase [Eubacteriales bacterium]